MTGLLMRSRFGCHHQCREKDREKECELHVFLAFIKKKKKKKRGKNEFFYNFISETFKLI
jgi:hypothetical protein